MVLATQCPACHTTFRVGNDQLKLRAGLVRCGNCRTVFNGIEHLVPSDIVPGSIVVTPRSVPMNTPTPSANTTIANQVTATIDGLEKDLSIATQSADQEIHLTPKIVPGNVDENSPGMTLIHVQGTPPNPSVVHADDDEVGRIIDELQRKPWSTAQDLDTHPEPEQTDTPTEPHFLRNARRKQRIERIFRWMIPALVGLLLLAFIGQTVYFFRDQLAVRLPQFKPWLNHACEKIGCQINFPMKIENISIESNELQILDPSRNLFTLNLLLRNRGDTIQAWPNIELSLNDINDKTVVRRVFTPQNYLSKGPSIAQGFGNNQEQNIKLTFELLELHPAGYKVYLFYP